MFLIIASLLQAAVSCIHTYPGKEAVNPDLTDITLRLTFPRGWDEFRTMASETGGRSAKLSFRISTVVETGEGKTECFTSFHNPESETGCILLTLPFKVTARSHSIHIWCDCADEGKPESAQFNISNLHAITPTTERIQPPGNCFSKSVIWTPSGLQSIPGTESPFEVELERPCAKFRLVAEDYAEFLNLQEKEIRKGKTYSIQIDCHSPVPRSFCLTEDSPCNWQHGISFRNELPILFTPGIEMELASDILFADKEKTNLIADLMVLDSSLIPISVVKGIVIPLERGKATTVSGNFLTHPLKTSISIDSNWNGEEEIKIEI